MKNIWNIISNKAIYKDSWKSVYQYKLQKGSQTKSYTYIDKCNSVVIIPLTETNNTMLLKQYRYPLKSYSLELPMGGINLGENPKAAAKRELKEEINLDTSKVIEVGKFNPDPGVLTETCYVFLSSTTKALLNRAYVKEGTDDIQDYQVATLDQIFKWIKDGTITDSFTITSIYLLRNYLNL